MAKSITKKFVAISLTILMVMMGLPMDVFAEAAKSTETFASPEETINVASSDLQDGRSINFNSDWKFNKGDVSNGQSTSLNDSGWRTLDLPHDWSIEGNFTTQGEAESGFLLGGTGWYRKTFKLSEKYKNKNISIEFGGVYMNCTVYVNGTELGTHPYGYTPFAFDLTKYLKYDGTNNVIAVKVNHQVPSSRWYSGSGIYRDVNLVVTDNVHVKRYGTKVTTPNLANEKGGNVDVNIETEVKNEENSSASVTVKNTVYNSSNEAVSTTVSKDATIGANSESKISQSTSVNNPSLWSTDSPTLYYVKTQVVKDGTVIDEYTTDFGFRYFNFNRNTGFSLNGQKMKLKGVCMHHDQGALGSVANYNAIERQVKKLKQMGANAIRVTHNPASDELLEICNKEGIMVIEEAFDGWARPKNGNENDYSKYFNKEIDSSNKIIDGDSSKTWAEFDIKQMVDRGKNNPCIIMWSLGNEILEGASTSTDNNYATYAQNLINWVKEIDTTRPTTIGDNNSKNSNSTYLAVSNVIANNGGIVGLNYSSNNQYLSLHNNHSNWTIYGSETSSAIRSRGIYTTKSKDDKNHQLTAYDKKAVGWGRLAADSWSSIITNDYIAGEFVWTGFDYIGEPTPWNGTGTGSVSGGNPSPNSSYFGIIDTAGFEKDIYYFYQSQWNDNVNTLHILPCWDQDSISLENGYAEVVVYSDAPTVELFLNGKSLGKKSFTTSTTSAGYKYKTSGDAYYLTWNVKYESGTLSAKAYDENGKEITNTQGRNSVTTSSTPSKLNATAEKSTIDADGYDLSYISVDVTDANGNIDPNASNTINFNLSGNGKIVGVDNGDATETSKFKPTSSTSASIKAFSGKALVIVQSTKEAGSFTLTASSGNLQSSSVTVDTKQVLDNTSSNEIKSYKISKDYYVYQNVTPQLPTSVVATYTDKTTKDVKIQWDSYDKNLLKKPNVFTVTGKLEGTDIEVKVNVHVVGNVVTALNYSTNTTAGVKPVLPDKVASVLEDGTVSEEFAVTWDDIDESKYSSEGTFVVNGSVTILDKTYDVTASVRVDKKAEESKNIALNTNSDAPTLSQSVPSGSQSDNLSSINNGTNNEVDDTNERWTNWKYRNTSSSAYVQMDWKNEYTIKRVNLYLFTDSSSAALPASVQFAYWNGSKFVDISSSSTTPVSYTSGPTEYQFDEAVKTNKLRVTLTQQSGHCIGLTEMEVFNVPESCETNTTALLSKLNVNGSSVEGFNAETKDYTVSANEDEKISVTAESQDNAAVTILPEFNNIIKVLVQSEDHQTINTYNIKVERKSEPVKGADKSQLKTALAKANDILSVENNKNIYTEATYNALKDARDAGQDVFDNNSATQTEVDKATEDINNAIAGLKEKEEDISGLSVSLSSDGQRMIVTGKVDKDAYDYSKIIKHGVLYIRQSNLGNKELTVYTPGRTRVNFGTYKEDGSFIYRFNPYNKDALYTARTFIQYKDANGKTCYEYSDIVSGSVFGLQQ